MMKENIIKDKSFNFSLQIIQLYKELQFNKEYVLSKQLLRSGTSIGANVSESEAALTKKDFIHKLSISSKEARESLYWLELLEQSRLVDLNYTSYIRDVKELIRILTSIIKTSQASLSK
ncbi:four helix bundle protein [uncultured Formosa sp.]|uniref:four helix bundle protein n=1 Tax=uncultured Formosa sp. TaxID=255435 RepID=UPI002611FD2E|nr:four helix bundle protein [uncultured Formosa sp.]